MEEYNRDAWHEIVERCQDAGVDAFELNMSCPHGLPERKMGAAMGENPDILEEVCGWVMEVAKKPVWAKMTPNVTHIEDPTRASLRAGCDGIARSTRFAACWASTWKRCGRSRPSKATRRPAAIRARR